MRDRRAARASGLAGALLLALAGAAGAQAFEPPADAAPGTRGPEPLPTGIRAGEAPGEYVNVADGSVLVWIAPGDHQLPDGRRVHLTQGAFVGRDLVSAAAELGDHPLERPGPAEVDRSRALEHTRRAGGRLPSAAELALLGARSFGREWVEGPAFEAPAADPTSLAGQARALRLRVDPGGGAPDFRDGEVPRHLRAHFRIVRVHRERVPGVPAIDGTVVEVRPGWALLSVGTDDRVAPGFRLWLYRQDRLLGFAFVERCERDRSWARLAFVQEGEQIERGDHAATLLDLEPGLRELHAPEDEAARTAREAAVTRYREEVAAIQAEQGRIQAQLDEEGLDGARASALRSRLGALHQSFREAVRRFEEAIAPR